MKEPLNKLDYVSPLGEQSPPLGEQLPDLSPRREIAVKNETTRRSDCNVEQSFWNRCCRSAWCLLGCERLRGKPIRGRLTALTFRPPAERVEARVCTVGGARGRSSVTGSDPQTTAHSLDL